MSTTNISVRFDVPGCTEQYLVRLEVEPTTGRTAANLAIDVHSVEVDHRSNAGDVWYPLRLADASVELLVRVDDETMVVTGE